VRTVTYAFRTPTVECDDLALWGPELVDAIVGSRPRCVVIQGWPPGGAQFATSLTHRGVVVKCVLHSSPTQHGGDAIEAAVADEILTLLRSGGLVGVGMSKAGVPEAFSRIGYPVAYVPNRAPVMPATRHIDLGEGFHVGIFADPYWRKNVTTQLLASAMIEGYRAHVMRRPGNHYLEGLDIVEHGELPYEEFLSLQGSVDINLYVTLSECHPSTPQESYLAGVPCLISRTSDVFRDDPVLWDLTTVELHDNPTAIKQAAIRLYENREEAVERALTWIDRADHDGEERWLRFTGS
jgi:hypothetical protein